MAEKTRKRVHRAYAGATERANKKGRQKTAFEDEAKLHITTEIV